MSFDLVKFPKILILLLLFSFPSFLGILFTPALPGIASAFSISNQAASLSMSIFLVGYTIGQLPYGPLSNRWGRKKAIGIGMGLALFGSCLAALSPYFWVLCLARFLQALGGGVGLKIVLTIIADVYEGKTAAKALATLSTAFGFMPGIAITAGGFITVYLGWRGCFAFLFLYTLILWGFCRSLPETAKELDEKALILKHIARGFIPQFGNFSLVLHAFLAGLSSSLIYVFATLSPYIGISRIGLNPDQFGLWSIIPSFGILSGALITRKIGSYFSSEKIVLIGIGIGAFSSFFMLLFFWKSSISISTLFIPPFFAYIGANLVWSNSLAQAVSSAVDKSHASAVMQFINMGTATLSVFFVSRFSPLSPLLLPSVFGGLALLMLFSWLYLRARGR